MSAPGAPSKGREHRLTLPDSRCLAWREYGDPDGHLVLALHGTPGSRFECHAPEAVLERLGLRLAVLDRPGYGDSDPASWKSVTDGAATFLALANALGAVRFGVYGVSMGALWGLALAAAAPARVTACALVSPYAAACLAQPPRDLAAQMVWAAQHAPWSLRAGVGLLDRVFPPAAQMLTLRLAIPPAEQYLLHDPRVTDTLLATNREVARHGTGAVLTDLRLAASPWGFTPADVRCPLAIWHGSDDGVVGMAHGVALAAAVPGATLHLVPGYGHLLAFEVAPAAMTFLADHAD